MNLSVSQNKSALTLTVPAPQLSRLDKIYAKLMRKIQLQEQPRHFPDEAWNQIVWNVAEQYFS